MKRETAIWNPYASLKRTTDILGALLLLVISSPLLLVIACMIRFSSPGPVFFRQKRLTEGGRIFTLLKFRTMRLDAETGSECRLASENDSRVTALGKWLRKYRLDELPQLLNVILGDMSLIGPRPERPELASKLEELLPGFRKRLLVPAGLTGLAQVEVGYAADTDVYRRKLLHDLRYVRRQSLLLDAKIALKTVQVVMTGFGAR